MEEQSNFVDYYALLKVPVDAHPEHIRRAFLRLAKTHHPDIGGSTRLMQQYTAAYRTLMSSSSRRAYDMLHEFHTGKTQAHFRDYGTGTGAAVDDLSDKEIDDFLDAIYAEYNTTSPQKRSLFAKLRQLFYF